MHCIAAAAAATAAATMWCDVCPVPVFSSRLRRWCRAYTTRASTHRMRECMARPWRRSPFPSRSPSPRHSTLVQASPPPPSSLRFGPLAHFTFILLFRWFGFCQPLLCGLLLLPHPSLNSTQPHRPSTLYTKNRTCTRKIVRSLFARARLLIVLTLFGKAYSQNPIINSISIVHRVYMP